MARVFHWPPSDDERAELRVLSREGDENAKAMLAADEKGILPPQSAIEWYLRSVMTPEERWHAERPVDCRCPFGMIHVDCPHHGHLIP